MTTIKITLESYTTRIVTFLFMAFSMLILVNSANAQSLNCEAAEDMQRQLAIDPSMQSRMEAMELDVQSRLATTKGTTSGSNLRTGIVTIPVVVHVIYNTSAQNISDAQIQSQIDALNEDFRALNADRINTPSAFSSLIGDAKIQFTLAKQDPNGNATNGITRTTTTVTAFSSSSVCYNMYGGRDAWATTKYLNIWVCNKSGAPGTSSYPWSGNPATDGVIVNYNFMGRTGAFATTYNLKGRTVTHEVGHWLGLTHIWGGVTCGDDYVADTPTQEAANSGSPAFPHVSSCSPNSNGDMFMNFMDYSDDATTVMFSLGQVDRMNGYLEGTRASIMTSVGGIAPGTTTTTTTTPVVCNVPTGLNVTSILTNGSTLTWSSTGALSYSVRYKSTLATSWISTSTSNTSLVVGGLTASTNYEFQVASVCSSTSSSAYSVSRLFTTATATTTTITTTTTTQTQPALVTIGNGLNSTAVAPYGTANLKEHAQFIITKSELVAAGYNGLNNLISSLSFNVNSASAQTMTNFTIKVSHTSSSAFSSASFLSTSNATTVFSASYKALTSWNKHNFTTPFIYNGTDNLLVDISWSNTSGSTSSTVKSTTTGSYQTLIATSTSKKGNLNTGASLSLDRPNMQLEFKNNVARLANIDNSEESINTSIKNIDMMLYPNPTESEINIAYTSDKAGETAKISIYSITGSLIAEYEHTADMEGRQVINLNANSDVRLSSLISGTYIVTLDVNETRTNKKVVLIRN